MGKRLKVEQVSHQRRHSTNPCHTSPHPLAALREEDGGVFCRAFERSCLHAADSGHNKLSMELTIFDTVTDRPGRCAGVL